MLDEMRRTFIAASCVIFGYVVGQSACGGTIVTLDGDGGVDGSGSCPPCGHRGPDVLQPDVREPDVSVEDFVVFEDSQLFDAPSESGLEDGDSEPPVDSGGLLPPVCAECLDKECPTPYDKCFVDPSCVVDIRCLDGCVADGGGPDSCAIHCIDIGNVDAGDIAAELLACAEMVCRASCGVSPTDAGGID
jgi:hypothetical protein